MLPEYLVETENTFYILCYNRERKEYIVQRAGSKRRAVCIKYEPLYVGSSMSIEDNCLVLKEGNRVTLKTTKILACFKKIDTIEFQ